MGEPQHQIQPAQNHIAVALARPVTPIANQLHIVFHGVDKSRDQHEPSQAGFALERVCLAQEGCWIAGTLFELDPRKIQLADAFLGNLPEHLHTPLPSGLLIDGHGKLLRLEFSRTVVRRTRVSAAVLVALWLAEAAAAH